MNTTNHISSLTPLRGIAAILVVVFHYNLLIGPLTSDTIMIVEKGYLMVDLFFVLSGFIMYHVYGSWFKNSVRRKLLLSYLKARFARIYPLHFFVLMFTVGMASLVWFQIDYDSLTPIEQTVLNPKAIPTSLLLVQAWGFHDTAPLNTAAWSISVEFFLYLLFPWIMWLMAHYGRLARWMLALVAVGSLLSITFYFSQNALSASGKYTIDVTTGSALLRGLAGFIAGILIYELYRDRWQHNVLKKGYWFVGIWLVLIALWTKDLLPDALAVGVLALLILQTAYVDGSVKKILSHKIPTYLGDISYSIYMVHIPLILSFLIVLLLTSPRGGDESSGPPEVTEVNYLQNWFVMLVFLLMVIGLASLTYRYIELPLRRKLKGRRTVKKNIQSTEVAS